MATLGDMIDEVTLNLAGYTLLQDSATHITAAVPITASTSAVPVLLYLGSSADVGKGVLEIDEELFWIDSFDRLGNTATVSPYGRGYLGTTAATHAVDTKVTIAPTFPRFVIKRAINDTITAIGSSLLATGSTTITSSSSVTAYRLPTTGSTLNVRNILSIAYEQVGASDEWIPIRKWRLDLNANATAFTSGQSVSIYDAIPSGRTIQIVYAKEPTAFTANTETFTTQTGLPESCKDLVILGATYRLLSNLDPARASMVSPQADEVDSKRPYGSSQSATKQIYALFNQRLNEEIKKMQTKFPIRARWSV